MSPKQWITWPHNGTVYLVEELCPEPRYLINDAQGAPMDPRALMLVDGALALDPAKVAEIKAEEAAQLELDQKVTRELSQMMAKFIESQKNPL